MKTPKNIELFINSFKQKKSFTTENAVLFFQKREPEISRNSVVKRIKKLIKEGVISRKSKGIYSFNVKSKYVPIITNEQQLIYKKLLKRFPYAEFCIWNTKIFNEFMIHQPARFCTIIETEKDTAEFVFNFLKENNRDVFLNPDKKTTNLYTVFADNCIIIKNLITEAPVAVIDKFPTVSIEKLLVDVFCEPDLFSAQQGSELENIFVNVFEKYDVNIKSLERYSNRRNKKEKITQFINKLINND